MLNDLGVRKLAAAVVRTAIRDSLSGLPSRQAPARKWILHDDRMFPFWCKISNISPERIKRTMEQRFLLEDMQQELIKPWTKGLWPYDGKTKEILEAGGQRPAVYGRNRWRLHFGERGSKPHFEKVYS